MDKYETFTDLHSGYKFCTKKNTECIEHMKREGIFEYPLIDWCKQFLNKDQVFLDIGAHMGTYSVILSSHCKEVQAFEISPETFIGLEQSIKANDISNVVLNHCGLGSKNEVRPFYLISEDGGGCSLMEEAAQNRVVECIDVTVKKLDDFQLNNICFIKIDVEGWELEVIIGARETLERNNYPPIIFEAWNEGWYKAKKDILFEYIKSLGYTIHQISGCNNMYLANTR